ncbi:MAG: fimbrial protein [Serratia liquefaciens]|nr:fimbrial protein [Serratia liquefaciens]
MRKILTLLIMGLVMSQLAVAAIGTSITEAQSFLPLPMYKTCSLSASTPVIDYGTQSRWQLQDVAGSNAVTPGKRTLILNVVCPYRQVMRLTLRGDRAANGNLRYGEQGSVNIRLLDFQLDGQSVQVAFSSQPGVIDGASESSLLLQPDKVFTIVQNGQLVEGQIFNARVEIEPVLPESAARVTSRQANEAHLMLEMD